MKILSGNTLKHNLEEIEENILYNFNVKEEHPKMANLPTLKITQT